MFTIDTTKNLLIYRPEGVINGESIMGYIQGVLRDPDYQPGLLEYIDLSGVSEWQLSHSEVEKVTHFDNLDMAPIKKISRTGIYAPTDVAFGMARMYQALAEKYHSSIFISKNQDEVLKYLGCSGDDI